MAAASVSCVCRSCGISSAGIGFFKAELSPSPKADEALASASLMAGSLGADFAASSFNVVWSIECTEHLFDKATFFQRVGRWVKPGGRVAICAWLAARDADLPAKRPQVEAVLEAFLCPSLGSFDDYRGWMTAAGLVVEVEEDWTARVCRTWEICDRRVKRLGLPWLARFVDPAQGLFLERFGTLLGAYTSGAMQYGCFVARRPPA